MGSGQLGRMFTQSAVKNGYHVICYSPDKNSPANMAGATDFTGSFTDLKKLEEFLGKIDALTFEFENIPETALDFIAGYALKNKLPVRPDPEAVRISQKRNLEKKFFNDIGISTAGYGYFSSRERLAEGIDTIPLPCIIKQNSFGYDGKGQYRVKNRSELIKIIDKLPEAEYIYEEIIEFDMEISVIAGRFADGSTVIYPPSQNIHKNGILDITIHPAPVSAALRKKAEEAAARLMDKLKYQGVLGLELFVRGTGIIANEFAPRPHNSGHYTMDAANFSQFDLQLNTLCNIPLTRDVVTVPSQMKNILGEDYKRCVKASAQRLQDPDCKLHLYGKAEPRKGRKMGHWNYVGKTGYFS